MFNIPLETPLVRPLLWAIVLHIILFLIFPQPRYTFPLENMSTKPVEISTLSPSEIKMFRTIGIKGGRKEFSIPVNNIPSQPPKLENTRNSSTAENRGGNRLQDPSALSISNEIPQPRIQYPSQRITKESFPSLAQQGMPQSTLNIGFEPPEGVSESELNSTEKIYYGFSKRTYEIYITSLIGSFNKLMREKPYIDLMKIPGAHNLTGRIVFNQEGRAVGTQFFLLSSNENLQQLFENALMDIRTIPNPPKGLLNRDGTFAVHYRLQVGN